MVRWGLGQSCLLVQLPLRLAPVLACGVAIEIERKFLVTGDGWRQLVDNGCRLRQGYLGQIGSKASVRLRCTPEKAFLTIKSEREGLVRSEFEYEICLADAEEMLATLCLHPPLEKTRYKLRQGELIWDIDEFSGELAGLVLAEVELDRVDQPVELPDPVGAEVTGDPRFRNVALSEARSIPALPESK